MKLTPTQQALLSLLAEARRDGASYPSCDVLARELSLDKSAVPVTLRRLAQLGALTIDPPGPGREGRSYARRLTLLWGDERIALGGAEQLTLWREV